jgi:hypothetical protein
MPAQTIGRDRPTKPEQEVERNGRGDSKLVLISKNHRLTPSSIDSRSPVRVERQEREAEMRPSPPRGEDRRSEESDMVLDDD